jgi:hypothetical protein
MLDIDMVAEVVLSVCIINLDHQLPTSLHLLLLLCPGYDHTRKQNGSRSAAKQGDEIRDFRSKASMILL